MRKKERIIKHNISELFSSCLSTSYDIVGNDVNYKICKKDSSLYIYFQWSNGKTDWKNNFRFRKKPYSDMKTSWKCHRGFLDCWNQVKPIVEENINDIGITEIVVVGYSHGAAIAVLCHEFCWFNRQDIKENIYGYGFGCPRVVGLWRIPKKLKQRWSNFTVIRKDNDLVTHVPPRILKFVHVNKPLIIGSRKDEGMIKSHYSEVYLRELDKYEQNRT